MALTKAEWEFLQQFREEVREGLAGVRKTLYGEDGRGGVVADVNAAKVQSRKQRDRMIYIVYPTLVTILAALVGFALHMMEMHA